MDISILSAAGAAGPQQRSSQTPSNSGENSFARSLEQASSRGDSEQTATAGAASPDTPPAVSAGAATGIAATTEPPAPQQAATPSSALASTATLDTASPAATLTAAPPVPAANSQEATAIQPVDAFDEIRRRLALIEQAGQLPVDAASAGNLAALVAPLTPTATPPASRPGAIDTNTGMPLDSLHSPTGSQPGTARDADPLAQPAAQAAATVDTAAAATTATSSTGNGTEPALTEASASLASLADTSPRSEPTSPVLLGPSAGSLASTASNQQMASPPLATLSAPLASREWQQGLGQQLIGLHQRGEQQIELHLHPSDLGPLSVSLKLGELGAQAQFLSAHPQVRAAIEQAIPQLREALAAQGISLGETSVGEQRQPPRDPQAGNGASTGASATVTAESTEGAQVTPAATTLRPLARGQVDLYA